MNNAPTYIAVDNRPTVKAQCANNCPIERKPSQNITRHACKRFNIQSLKKNYSISETYNQRIRLHISTNESNKVQGINSSTRMKTKKQKNAAKIE